ncbi:hypothetical protein JCM6882_007245 [Rhodosporidiobolus microsporus]
MCRSIAAIGYGLFVRTASLLAAADAHAEVEPVRRFVELVKLRRARGTLRAGEEGEGTAVLRLPSELWEMILQEAIDEEVVDATKRLAANVLRSPCLVNTEVKEQMPYKWPAQWDAAVQEATHDACSECADLLLEQWEMALCEREVHSGSAQLAPLVDFSTEMTSDIVTDVSFEAPPDADARLKRLVRAYGLTLTSQTSGKKTAEEDSKGNEDEGGEEGAAQAEWKLFCRCETV